MEIVYNIQVPRTSQQLSPRCHVIQGTIQPLCVPVFHVLNKGFLLVNEWNCCTNILFFFSTQYLTNIFKQDLIPQFLNTKHWTLHSLSGCSLHGWISFFYHDQKYLCVTHTCEHP